MIPYVTYFDMDASGRFLPLLQRFLCEWEKIPKDWVFHDQLTILTDDVSHVGFKIPESIYVRRVSPNKYARELLRPGNPGAAFDYKAALIMALIHDQQMPDPALIMDCDNRVLRNPVLALRAAGVRGNDFAIGADPGRRVIRHSRFSPSTVIEESSSVLVLPSDSRQIAVEYLSLWAESSEPAEPLLEQRTWSLVQAMDPARRVILPRILSWSREWGPAPADCVLRHLHGAEKWEGIG